MAVRSAERGWRRAVAWSFVAICLTAALALVVQAVRTGSAGSLGYAVVTVGLAALTSTEVPAVFVVGDDEIEVQRWFWPHRIVAAGDIARIQDFSGGLWRVHLRNGREVRVPLGQMTNAPEVRAALRSLIDRHDIPFEPLERS